MKIILFLTLLLPIFRLEAAIDPKVERFLELPSSQAAAYLKDAQIYRIRGDLITAAIEARRLDLIEICFRNDSTCLLTVEAVAEIKDLDFQDQVMITILKAKIEGYWPMEDPFQDGHRISLRSYLERFSCVLFRHFPDMPKDGKCFETYAKRLELAKKLETSIAAKKPQTGEIPPPPKQAEPTPQKPAPIRTETAPDLAGATAPKKSPWAIGLVAAALVILLGMAGLRWIRRGRSS